MNRPRRAFCDDCLRAPVFSTDNGFRLAKEGRVRCVCGGELFTDEEYLHTFRQLAIGRRGFVDGVADSVATWSAEDGATWGEPREGVPLSARVAFEDYVRAEFMIAYNLSMCDLCYLVHQEGQHHICVPPAPLDDLPF